MNDYITIKEAVELSGKSDSSIRRAIRDSKKTVTVKEGNKVLVQRSFIESHFKVSPVLGMIEHGKDFDLIKAQERIITSQKNTIDKQQELLEGLRGDLRAANDNLKESNNALSMSLLKNIEIEKKLLEAKEESKTVSLKSEEQSKFTRQDLLFVLGLLLVCVFLAVLWILSK